MSTALKLPSYADIEALPEGLTGEILGGQLIVSPRPAKPHLRTATALGGRLFRPFNDDDDDGPGGWHLFDEPELHLDTDPDFPVVVPDLAGWRHATLPVVDDDEAAFRVRPDWVCEILSPRTAVTDRVLKMPFYARAGVVHAWLIDPVLRTLEVYRNAGGQWLAVAAWEGEAVVRAEPFDAIELPLRSLWLPKRPVAPPTTPTPEEK
ncbi:Uma2 family endonuclease [Myxococcota bacterium]|jgi:Uma2 family endonuclease|nr:Uma2 family endonuclease [Myxococcota bacterium]